MPDSSNTAGTRIPEFEDEFFPLEGFPGYLISREGIILSQQKNGGFRVIGLNGKTATVRTPEGGYKRLWIRTLLRGMFPELEDEQEDATSKTGRGRVEAGAWIPVRCGNEAVLAANAPSSPTAPGTGTAAASGVGT